MANDIRIACTGSGLRDIDTLQELQGDLKSISKENLTTLKNRIVKYGFDAPVFVWENYILDGHQRIQAVKSLIADGYALPDNALPIVNILATSVQDAKKRLLGYVSQYGKLTSRGFDHFIGDLELGEIRMEIDLPGYDLSQYDKFQILKDAPVTTDNSTKAIKTWKVKPGQIWKCGDHRIMCGDSLDPEHIRKLMQDDTAEMLFTSPPYTNMREYKGEINLSIEHLAQFLPLWKEHVRYQIVNLGLQRKDGEVLQWWDDYIRIAKESGLLLLAWNVWAKQNAGSVGMQKGFMPVEHEWLFVFGSEHKEINKTVKRKTKAQAANKTYSRRQPDGSLKTSKGGIQEAYKKMSSVTFCNTELGKIRSSHPATFPVELPAEYIKAMTSPGDIVCDCFMGSGTTMIACENLGRIARGMEISPEYVAVSLQRYLDLTGNEPRRLNVN
jgi:DNA modification methylase